MSSDVFIVGAARTPVGSFQGALANQNAPQLGAHAIAAAISQAGVDASAIDEVIMGNVVSAGLKQAPARQAMRQAMRQDALARNAAKAIAAVASRILIFIANRKHVCQKPSFFGLDVG